MRRAPAAGRLSRLAVLVGAFVVSLAAVGAAVAEPVERVGYCLNGEFLNLVRGQPSADPAFDGWVRAWYVDGKGITCDPPPTGWVATTTAPDELGVPGKTYAWYRPPAAS